MTTAALVALAVASGFGSTVWVMVSIYSWHRKHRWVGFWYGVLALSYLGVGVIIIGRIRGHFQDLPQGFSALLLTPIFVVPPAIQLGAWIRARRLIEKSNG